ncbi:integrase, catalytic region, zinc finger, CCHC-type containing protein [Tanacetum coccineum]|uniref:Integrase, catalytic region, zinc finger, CCHC-type containing protein n=1 Tax=Tanacetum coccineum TaxID=301880 RepID=A0ABQ5CS35_9ASTR
MSEQMINHVNNWEKANKEQNNESITAELERYKERNPFHLKKSPRIKPTLYDGIAISDKHVVMLVIDDEETLIKQNISHKPIDYEKLNRLSDDFRKRFTLQQELSTEQVFWLRMSNPTSKPSDASYIKIDAPKELPKTIYEKGKEIDDLAAQIQSANTIYSRKVQARLRILCTRYPSSSSLVMTFVQIVHWYLYSDLRKMLTISIDILLRGALGHNLFSVGQFANADLEVKSENPSLHVNIEGVELHSRIPEGTNLYTISLDDMHIKHLRFVFYLKRQRLRAGKSKKSSHQPKAEDTNQEKLYLFHMDLYGPLRMASINGKRHLTSKLLSRLLIKNGLSKKRRNQTLVEAARTMLIFSKALLFLWAEAINTACYTQNRSIIRHRYNKTPYELMQDKKPDLSFFHVFGALCYPTNDNDDLGKLDAKADIDMIGIACFNQWSMNTSTPPNIVVSPVQEVVASRAVILADSPSTSID